MVSGSLCLSGARVLCFWKDNGILNDIVMILYLIL